MAIEKIRPRVVDATGNYTFNNVELTGNISAPTAIISNLTGVTNLVASSTTINVTGILSVTSNISAGNVKTDNLLYANGSAWPLGGSSTPPAGSNTQVQFNDTSSFGASANFTFNKSTNTLLVTNISANGAQLSNLTGSNITGQVANAVVAETIYANAQPNITSVGTLTSLTITGNLVSGNASLGNSVTSNYFIGDGTLLSSISGGNVTGQVAYAATANSVSGSNVVGQVTFAATANAVAGSNVMGTVSQATYATTANSVAGSNVSGTVSSATTAETVTTAAQPNITSVGTLTSLTSTGNVSIGTKYFLGNGYYLTGVDQLAAGSADVANSIANGTSNISTPISGGNITVGIGGTSNTVIFTSTGVNVAGYISPSTGSGTNGIIWPSNPGGGTGDVASIKYYAATGEKTRLEINVQNDVPGIVQDDIYFTTNSYVVVNNATEATSTSSAPFQVLGGAGVAKKLYVGGNIEAGTNYIKGNGYYLTGVDQLAAGSADIANSIANGTSNVNTPISGGNITVGIGGTSNTVIFTSTGVNIAGHLTATANVTGSFIKGNGFYLTGVDQLAAGSADVANSIANGTSNINTPVSGGNITVGIGGVSNRVIFTSTGVNIAGYANLGSGDLTTIGNVVAGYISVTGTTSSTSKTTGALTVAGGLGIAGTIYNNRSVTQGAYGNIILNEFTGIYNQKDTGTSLIQTTTNALSAGVGVLVFGDASNGSVLYSTGNLSISIGVAVRNEDVPTGGTTPVTISSTGIYTTGIVNAAGNINSLNANLGNTVTANYFVGSGIYVTGVTAVTAATVTTNAQPNITSVGTLTNLIVGNATANTTFGDGTITATGNISFTGANVSLGDASNLKITGGTAGYFITTDGAGNLSWGAAVGGGGVGATGSNTQIQFNDGGVLGATANLVFNKTTNTLTTGRVVASAGANLGNNVSNLYIGGGGASQILSTDGSGNLSWIAQPTAVITVDNFTGNGVQTTFTLSTTPASINQTVINYNGAFQLRSAYTLTGSNITFSEAPANGSLIEVTTTIGATSGAGAFVTRTYTGNGVATTFTVTSGVTVSSVLVTENGLVQTPTVDYTIAGSTLTFIVAPANGITIQIRELAISIATTNAPVYRAYTGNGVANTFTITSGLTANSLIVAENGVIQRPTTDYSVSGSNIVFVSPPANNVDIQIRELSLNGGGTSSGGSLTIKEEGSNLTTAVTSINFVGGGVTATNTGNAVTVTVPTGTTRAQAMTMGIIFGG